MVPEGLVESWKTSQDQTQVIGQAEAFPVLVARLTWAKYLAGRRVIYFLDNEAARIALVRSYSPVLPTLKIVMRCISWDFSQHSDPWYARVPTVCNVADAPSRMAVVCAFLGKEIPRVPPVFPDGPQPLVVLK